ncbi:MAG: hypothetical protein KBG28_17625 [Kofleriaceae bacterium]|nr:hypothetical protein [Kofleriaceae bacterium]
MCPSPLAGSRLVVALVAAGCGAAPTPAAPATAPGPCQVDRTRLAHVRQLRITEVRDGHDGDWQVLVALRGHGGGDFEGVAQAVYRPDPRQPYRAAHAPASLPRAEVEALIDAFVDGLTTPASEARPRIVMTDSSHSTYLAIDLVDEQASDGVQFAVDRGEDTPLPWRLRGCAQAVSSATQADLTRRWEALRARLGVPALRATLTGYSQVIDDH